MTGARTNRRQFMAGLLAAGVIPKPSWADVGSPMFLSAAAKSDESFVLCGINAELSIAFELPLPARGHAAAAHPMRPEAVAFARRPGTFAVVVDCVTGAQTATLTAPAGRHFYGHGAFSADGQYLLTTENDYETGRGRIGVWDAAQGYKRIDEWDSGGIGPHDIKRLPGTDIFVVANGGIDTHPDSGRTKLNIPTMRPNLSYVEDGAVLETVSVTDDMHKNSIRHLAVNHDGNVVFGMQWEGQSQPRALVGTHRRGEKIALMHASHEAIRAMDGYIGSVAISQDSGFVAATSPRGGQMQIYDTKGAILKHTYQIEDVCGVAQHAMGFSVTSGTGALHTITAGEATTRRTSKVAWDNHLIQI